MFHVEHMNKFRISYFIIFFICLSLFSCTEKRNPNPELTDVIYVDLSNEHNITIKQEADVQAQLAKDSLAYRKTEPQKNKTMVNLNKMTATENLLAVIQQQKKFFEIKLEQRKIFVQKKYLESFLVNGKPWPDESEIADYKTRLKLQHDKFNWDTKNVPRGTSEKQDKESVKKPELKK